MNSETKKGGKILKTAILMVIITLFAKVLGLLRDVLLAAAYGTSADAVAYDTASRLPLIIFDFVIGGVVTASFIPVFNDLLIKKDKKEAFDFANSYINAVLLITAILAAIGMIFADPLVAFLAPDIDTATHTLAVSLSRVMFPMIIFTGLAFSFVGFLQSLGSFLLPTIISLVSNLIMVLYFVFFNERYGIRGLAVSMLLGWLVQALIQLPSVLKKGYRYSPRLDFKSVYIKKSLIMALPILISSWVQPFCNLINTRFASSIDGGGAIPAMGYANRLYLIIVGVFTFVATNLLFPYFSKAEASGDKAEGEKLTRNSIKALELIIIPITAGIFVLAEPIVSFIYQRNAFGAADVEMTAQALRFFSLGMPFYALCEISSKKFFAEKNTLPPMITALVSIVINFISVMLLSQKFGIAGIAVSSSIAILANALLSYILRYRKGDKMLCSRDFVDILIMLISSVLMATLVLWVKVLYLPNNILGLIISVIFGCVIYILLGALFGESLTKETIKKILKK